MTGQPDPIQAAGLAKKYGLRRSVEVLAPAGDDEALRAAYERTIMKKQSLDWSYMNGILRRWHEKGLHTLAAIQAGDRDPRPVQAAPVTPQSQAAASREDQRAREDMERIRRLMEQMKQEE